MKSLPAELREFVNEVTGGAHAGESWAQRGQHVVSQGLDVIGAAIAALDEQNKEADLAELGASATAAAIEIAAHFLKGKPLKLQTAKAAIGFVVPSAVMALGIYSPQVEAVRKALLPLAVGGEAAFARLRQALGG